jgi:intracellular sulfur oxidation DsrE/DsrF family protein
MLLLQAAYSLLLIQGHMKLKHLLLAVATLLISTFGFSQKSDGAEKDNLLFLLRKPEHINQALKTIEQLQSTSNTSLKPGKAVIIVCGEAVTVLGSKDAEAWVQKISKYSNVSIEACGLSLSKFNKTRNDLVKGIGYTENGFIRAFELQKEGYLSVEL